MFVSSNAQDQRIENQISCFLVDKFKVEDESGAPAPMVSDSFLVKSNQVYSLSAKTDLPEGQHILIAERMINGSPKNLGGEARTICVVESGALTAKITFTEQGYYFIAEQRLNSALSEKTPDQWQEEGLDPFRIKMAGGQVNFNVLG